MVQIGKYNDLTVSHLVDFGLYLDGGDGTEILLPSRYIEGDPQPGDTLRVFIYTDSEDRIIATTEKPLAQVGECAFLQVSQVNNIGAFLDWGLSKDLLVPFREQKMRMEPGRRYVVYVYLDDVTKRIVASAKIEKFLGNTIPTYQRGDQVNALVYQYCDLGFKVVVDNLFQGLLYHTELFRDIHTGDTLTAYVKTVREDNKLDLTLSGKAAERVAELADHLLADIKRHDGQLPINETATPEKIKLWYSCSKKDFKKAIGHLLKAKIITIHQGQILLRR